MTGSWTIQIWWIIRGVSHFDFGEVPMVLVLGHNHTAFISHILDTSRMRCQNSRRWRLCLPLTWWRARWLPQRGRFSKTRLGVPERLPWFILGRTKTVPPDSLMSQLITLPNPHQIRVFFWGLSWYYLPAGAPLKRICADSPHTCSKIHSQKCS